MPVSTTGNWENYSTWIKNIARNSRITPTDAGETVALRTFLKSIWNPVAQTGTRSWLDTPFKERATAAASGNNYICNIDVEPIPVLIRLLELVGRDLKKIPMTDVEQTWADTFMAATDNRRLGTGPIFGNVGGVVYTLPH
jgi:hypothetical protein